MKRNSLRLLSIFLSIFGVASLVGTGFAVFVFIEEGTTVSAKEASVGLSIEPVAISGEFRIEQAPSKLVLSEGNKTSNDLFEGINFYTSKYDENGDEYSEIDDKLVFTFSKPTGEVLEYLTSLKRTRIRLGVKFEVSNTINDGYKALSSYVETVSTLDYIYDSSFGFNKYYDSNSSIQATIDPYNEILGIDRNLSNTNTNEISYFLRMSKIFKYISLDEKPNTLAKYNSLVTNCTNNKFWNIKVHLMGEYIEP